MKMTLCLLLIDPCMIDRKMYIIFVVSTDLATNEVHPELGMALCYG